MSERRDPRKRTQLRNWMTGRRWIEDPSDSVYLCTLYFFHVYIYCLLNNNEEEGEERKGKQGDKNQNTFPSWHEIVSRST